ncbi:hypothetical protein LXL04_021358 [Taraxacum kok-saghyz]
MIPKHKSSFQIPPHASRLLPLAVAESLSPHSPRTKSSPSFCLHSFADSFRLHQFADSLFEQPPCRRRLSIRPPDVSSPPSLGQNSSAPNSHQENHGSINYGNTGPNSHATNVVPQMKIVEPSRAREAHIFHELELELEIEARGELEPSFELEYFSRARA